jgi:hypothetical protein
MTFFSQPETQPVSLELLRVRHRVRLIQPEEEGFTIGRLPAGVYGFACALGQAEVPVFAHRTYHGFEIHKAADGCEYLIGFVTPAEAVRLEAGEEGAAIQLFPDPWETSQNLVSVPRARMVEPREVCPAMTGTRSTSALGNFRCDFFGPACTRSA